MCGRQVGLLKDGFVCLCSNYHNICSSRWYLIFFFSRGFPSVIAPAFSTPTFSARPGWCVTISVVKLLRTRSTATPISDGCDSHSVDGRFITYADSRRRRPYIFSGGGSQKIWRRCHWCGARLYCHIDFLSHAFYVDGIFCPPPRPTHLCKVGDIDSFRSYGGAAHVRGQLTAATVENVSNSYINFQVCRPIRMRNLNDFRYSWRRRHVHSLGQKDV